jgi:molybdopterin converting factor small subunit
MIQKTAVFVVTVLFFAGFACSASAVDFTADMVISSAQGGEIPGKVFVKGQKMRQEIETSQGKQAMILDPGKNVIYVLMPGAPIYIEVENKEPSVVVLDKNQTLESRFKGEADVTHEKAQGAHPTMHIELRLKGYLATITPAARFKIHLPTGSRVTDLLDASLNRLEKDVRDEILDVSKEVMAENVFVFLDNRGTRKQVSLDTVLQEGDVVTIASPLAGG